MSLWNSYASIAVDANFVVVFAAAAVVVVLVDAENDFQFVVLHPENELV